MKRATMFFAGLVVLGLVGGCSITGTWETVQVEPAEAQTPFQMVTFTDEGQYSATDKYGEGTRTVLGTYDWNGLKLEITPAEGDKQVYSARHDVLLRRLVLKYTQSGQEVTATLKKQADLPK